jgi:bla regulator protein blaR1
MKLLALATIGAAYACAQVPAPSFDVASVRAIRNFQGPLPDGFSMRPRRSGGRISWVTGPAALLRYSFDLPAWRIVGGSPGAGAAFYSIQATMDASVTDAEIRLMLQKLLADRFKLTVHRETKEVEGYALLVNKGGPKIKAAVSGEDHPMPDYLGGKTASAFEGSVFVSVEGKGISALTGRGVSIAQMADTLSSTLNTAVRDETSLEGRYYFGFKFLNVDSVPAPDVEGVPLFSAIQSELGLKLEKRKLPVEMLVVDDFEAPSEN